MSKYTAALNPKPLSPNPIDNYTAACPGTRSEMLFNPFGTYTISALAARLWPRGADFALCRGYFSVLGCEDLCSASQGPKARNPKP